MALETRRAARIKALCEGRRGRPLAEAPLWIGPAQVEGVRDELEQFFHNTDSLLARLRELIQASEATPELGLSSEDHKVLAQAIRSIEAAGIEMAPFDLHVVLSKLSRALGGSGVRYFR